MNLDQYKSFNWFLHRRYIIFALLIDFCSLSLLSYYCNFNFVNLFNSYNLLFVFIWISLNYIFGRYTSSNLVKSKLFFKHIKITVLVILISFFIILINLILGNIIFSELFYLLRNLIIYSFLTGISHSIHELIKSSNKKYNWLLVGDAKDKNFIQELLSARNKYEKIDLINIKELEKIENILIYDGILISDKLDISSQELFNQILCIQKYDIQFFRIFEWCKSYLNRIPSKYVNDSSQFKKFIFLRKVRFELFLKRLMDIFFSILILVITSPLILISMLFIYLEDGGSVLYRQSRSGLNGKLIKISKLRTMSIDAEVKGAQWAKKNDFRITKIGKILRKTRIDELPQLISVIKGDMSLIGPRPERPEIERDQLHVLRNYNLRYLFKPGLSGWSQVNYPYGASVKDSDIKLSFDLFYLANFSLLLDLIIFFKTIKLVLNAQGSKPR